MDYLERDVSRLSDTKADLNDLERVEDELKGIRHEVRGLRDDIARGRQVQPWTRGQRIAAAAVVVTTMIGVAGMLITLLTAGTGSP
jgi:hypothetical protein